ncbi:ACP phosphodiesterase [Psychroserpens sp.]|uniref:acyl carrier protein phosphodiesterase n=1 Tax=Psychroserpens sp. TaxID=2020870 RepID=UPI001B010A73|nr:ACP phosphodiesterase [Psychroserpens sp.]MBO6607421.1 acyl carrier protein phosphodiesterase [Psychroserpens sp.]MBO6632368.1 acyl carrier protein phosphodiesterase [Psychroserpens sp.]MBO6654501.1 acyl carrier protein phosphodiesterase [Psychroserpens sp.]MBO6681150.1 acyl carrier protein phosphodiesterase [Psychroserpens sp.]MBO6749893.1 acyl carrier protein phosphodiesterase [Psychroserpens sp.]
MNFLAHIYLSQDIDDIIIGNFIADNIRGKRYQKYSVGIQKGILLHRQIDSFTDSHPIVRLSTKRLHQNYGHYSSVIVDILYDHFLAKNWDSYSQIDLESYTKNFYNLIMSNIDDLPEKTQNMMPYMISGNWLLNYAKIEGIQSVLNGMNRRTKFKSNMNLATRELIQYYAEFESEFTEFFDVLIQFSKKTLDEIHLKFEND